MEAGLTEKSWLLGEFFHLDAGLPQRIGFRRKVKTFDFWRIKGEYNLEEK